jgi:hypothetical protein
MALHIVTFDLHAHRSSAGLDSAGLYQVVYSV